MGMNLPWTREEDEKLLAMFHSHEYVDIARAIGRPVGGVKKRAVALGLYKNNSSIINSLTKEQIEMLVEARNGKLSIESITRMIGKSRFSVARAINILGLPRKVTTPKNPRKKKQNLEPLELAEGHFAADQRSYEILSAAMNEQEQ